ncbi:hypothetical protein SISSUDRAFT_1041679 [Sistotremastrum suecicum HHB10207 ss-3]|uniref:Uncharacterized protein n=1 Tax=Sistotremastrum suecicum HHB10207 ss-3 TaxID=1314776 RepID=A0A166H5Q1_9AGAM|nr:hypothetical protein SISSUDRAFT_1041679 [Sistotremastrum suecicum HHB10207 ss-3]
MSSTPSTWDHLFAAYPDTSSAISAMMTPSENDLISEGDSTESAWCCCSCFDPRPPMFYDLPDDEFEPSWDEDYIQRKMGRPFARGRALQKRRTKRSQRKHKTTCCPICERANMKSRIAAKTVMEDALWDVDNKTSAWKRLYGDPKADAAWDVWVDVWDVWEECACLQGSPEPCLHPTPRETRLDDLIVPSRRQSRIGAAKDFEIVPFIKDVLVLDDFDVDSSLSDISTELDFDDDWSEIGFEDARALREPPRASYAKVTRNRDW